MHFYNELRLRYRPNYVNYLHQTLLYPLKRGEKKQITQTNPENASAKF